VDWITEISHLEEPLYFVDEQRYGPYSMWHHEHHFKVIDANTTEMTDVIHYKLPLGVLGRAVNRLVV
jgi:ligand-binding SRPBCC domain-containing protein